MLQWKLAGPGRQGPTRSCFDGLLHPEDILKVWKFPGRHPFYRLFVGEKYYQNRQSMNIRAINLIKRVSISVYTGRLIRQAWSAVDFY